MNIEDIVAERVLTARDTVANETNCTLRFARPVAAPNKGWMCQFEISGLGDTSPYAAHGLDSLQALLLAVEMARAQVTHRAAAQNMTVSWMTLPDIGLSLRANP
jgi:hypothetical protein